MAASSRLGVLMKLDKNQRKPRIFKASDLCTYNNTIVDPAHDSGCLHILKTPLLCFAFRQPYFLQNPVVYADRAAHGRSSFFFKKCLPRRKTSPEQSASAPGTFSDRSAAIRRSPDRRGRGACTFSVESGWRASRAGRRRWHRSRCP